MFSFFLNDRAPSENGQSGLCPGLQHRRSAGVLARETGAALPGTAVLVTGAARGIGMAIAEYLAKCGAKVVDS
jgi:FlaA1/EpsC-like NDP-sugar epimerase